MKKSVLKDRAATKGFSFGLTSAVITIIGMVVGVNTATRSRIAVIAGIVSVAVADTMSDSFGIHISEEAEGDTNVWKSTIYTFLSKFSFAILFLLFFLFFDINIAVILSIVVGVLIISVYSFIMAKIQDKTAWKVVGEHLLIAVVVISLTYLTGYLIRTYLT